MTPNTNKLKINGSELERYLTSNHINKTSLSNDLGVDSTYIGRVIRSNAITKPMYKLLCVTLGFDASGSTFLIKEDEPRAESKEDVPVSTTTINAISPSQMDALIGALNSIVEVQDRLCDMLDMRLKADVFVKEEIRKDVNTMATHKNAYKPNNNINTKPFVYTKPSIKSGTTVYTNAVTSTPSKA